MLQVNLYFRPVSSDREYIHHNAGHFSGVKRVSTQSLEIPCLEAKRRKMVDSRCVQSDGSITDKQICKNVFLNSTFNHRKRNLQSFSSDNPRFMKAASYNSETSHDSFTNNTQQLEERLLNNNCTDSTNNRVENSTATFTHDSEELNNELGNNNYTTLNNNGLSPACVLCSAFFSCEEELRAHLSSEHHLYRFMCLLCGCTNDDELIVFDHAHTHHPHIFMCRYGQCCYTSTRQAAVCDHVIREHNITSTSYVTEGLDADKYYDKQQQYIAWADI